MTKAAKEPGHCGLDTYWLESEDSFMESACVAHDFYYDAMYAGTSQMSQNQADEAFLRIALTKANNVYRKLVAYTFYGIAHVVGWFRWQHNKRDTL